MEMPDGKQRQPNVEAALWYLRSKAKYLPTQEVREFASWLRRSPENASALLSIATRAHRGHRESATSGFKRALALTHGEDSDFTGQGGKRRPSLEVAAADHSLQKEDSALTKSALD